MCITPDCQPAQSIIWNIEMDPVDLDWALVLYRLRNSTLNIWTPILKVKFLSLYNSDDKFKSIESKRMFQIINPGVWQSGVIHI